MANNPYVNKFVFGNEVKFDLSGDDVQASDVRSGVKFHLPSGEPAVGTASGGGGNPVAEEKTVNFIDYDGTIRYSYTAAEFGQLSALPANPTHTGRIAQGWNWTLAQINAQLAACPGAPVWVGQQYTTSDGKTHIHVEFPADTPASRRTFNLRFRQTVAYGVEVDWGDGSTPESHGDTSQSLDHTYADPGEYDITLDAVDGALYFIYAIGKTDDISRNRTRITDIAFGDNVTSIGEQALYGLFGHFTMSVPSGVAFSGYYMCGSAYALSALIIPSGTTSVAERLCRYCFALSVVSVPSGVTTIGPNAFFENHGLRSITIPNGVTIIGANAFDSCYGLLSIDIPSSVTSIGDSAFSRCAGVGAFHIRATTPPTLGSSVFSGIASDCVIYVPSASVNAYKSATNWSSYASYIQAEPS
ncbi:MAG: leucine-rich repeat domain-containing protein [Bacteroidales bacterium]|nr:leucine-rich repeat domain-containing protein [Bacteroidales bacterium]